MKVTLFALFVGLLMVGCGESSTPSSPSDPVDSPKAIDLDDKETLDKIIAEAIDFDTLQGRGGGKVTHYQFETLAYAPNEQTPYTGWVKMMYDGRLWELIQYKGGERDGLSVMWYDNGQKSSEGNFKDGKLDGLWASWRKNGQKMYEENLKDGKLMSAVGWKPNGERCPVTNVKNGNGLVISYLKNGMLSRTTYKDGEEVSQELRTPPNP